MVGGRRREAELREDAGHVLLDRAFGDHEGLGDPDVGAAFGHEPGYFVLARGQHRERVVAPAPPEKGGGIKSTAGVVTSAAVVMIAVFSIFGTLSFIDMKQVGVGLAVAVLIDATIIRGSCSRRR